MTTLRSSANEKQFRRSLNKALKIIKNGKKPGADNLELYLPHSDWSNLHSLINTINTAELEYKQGKTQKIDALTAMLKDYKIGKTDGLKKLTAKEYELMNINHWYTSAVEWLEGHDYGEDFREHTVFPRHATHLHPEVGIENINYVRDIPGRYFFIEPPSKTPVRNLFTFDELNNLHNAIGKKVCKTDLSDPNKFYSREEIEHFKQAVSERYAYARKDALDMLDSYMATKSKKAYT